MSTQASDRTRGLRIADERVLEAIFNPEEPAGSAIEASLLMWVVFWWVRWYEVH